VGKALALNLVTVTTITAGLLLFGDRFLRVWAGAALANRTNGVFAPIVIGSALTGLSITGIYALQALGQFRTVSIILLGCRLGMSLLMLALVRHQGVHGLVIVRMLYGASTLLVYVPLVFRLQIFARKKSAVSCEPTVSQLPGGSRA
jgi:O-antigen/teichoic acid export membrane protein